jgi:hypothetical protein
MHGCFEGDDIAFFKSYDDKWYDKYPELKDQTIAET